MAVDYSHLMGVCNRDIKLTNILMEEPGEGCPVVKLIDFGTSKHAELDSAPDTCIGTPTNMAPEVRAFNAQRFQRRSYDGKLADIWSCGMCLYHMVYGLNQSMSLVSDNSNDPTARTRVDFPQREPSETGGDPVSKECEMFLNQLLQHCPDKRITMDQIWEHPWFLQELPIGAREYNTYMAKNRVDQMGNYDDRQTQEDLQRILEEAQDGQH